MEPLPTVRDLIPALRRNGFTPPDGVLRVGAFGDSSTLSAELLALIRDGRKRGGASLAWAHEADSEPIPAAGEIEIVVDHLDSPSLVLFGWIAKRLLSPDIRAEFSWPLRA
jgi:hypothetical protein